MDVQHPASSSLGKLSHRPASASQVKREMLVVTTCPLFGDSFFMLGVCGPAFGRQFSEKILSITNCEVDGKYCPGPFRVLDIDEIIDERAKRIGGRLCPIGR